MTKKALTHNVQLVIPGWQEAVRKMIDCAKRTGYTTSIVHRDGGIVITIAPREGDFVLARHRGKHGMLC